MYYMATHHTKITRRKNPPAGRTGGLSAVTLPFLQLKLGRKVSGDPPLSLLKRKKEAKKEKSSPTLVLHGNVPHEDYTSTKIPRRGEQAAAAAVTLPFLHLKLGRKVSGDPPLSLLKRKKEAKKEKNSRSTCTVRFQYHPKITQETVTIDSHQQNSPGGANRRLLPP